MDKRKRSDLYLDVPLPAPLRERSRLVQIQLAAIAELDRRKIWVRFGYRSLLEYLHAELGVTRDDLVAMMKTVQTPQPRASPPA